AYGARVVQWEPRGDGQARPAAAEPRPAHESLSREDLTRRGPRRPPPKLPRTPPRSAPPPEPRVPRVPQRITEQIESEHRQADREAREDREPGRLLHEGAPRAAQHQAPRRRRRLSPQAQEAQRRLDQDGVPEPDRRDDQDGRRHVGEDVSGDAPWMAAADRW